MGARTVGDSRFMPLTEAVKTKVDIAVAVPTALAMFKAIPWPEIAGMLACIYWLVRITQRFFDSRKEEK
jgi:hypothetical protein